MAVSLECVGYRKDFEPFRTKLPPQTRAGIAPDELESLRTRYPGAPSADYVECMELCTRVSDALLPFGRAVFHGLAFLWRGRAWILTAPSGVGKTTHYLLWKLLWEEEVRIINGDKPILEARPYEIRVHPSPWYGKEGMRGMSAAPLAGLVLLEQGAENRMERLTPRAAAAPLFPQILFTASAPALVYQACALEEAMLRTVPVWRLVNRGDTGAAVLCRETLERSCCE